MQIRNHFVLSSLPLLAVGLLLYGCTNAKAPAAQPAHDSTVAGAVATPSTTVTTLSAAASTTNSPEYSTGITSTETMSTTAATTIPETTTGPIGGTALELSAYAGRPGDSVSLKASGFAPGENVTVRFAGSPNVDNDTQQANDRGEVFVQSFNVPSLSEGQHDLTVVGHDSLREVARVFSVVGFHPSVVLSNYALHPGESSDLTGSGFVPGESVSISLDGATTPMAIVIADARGNLQQQALLQGSPQNVGKHNLELEADQSGVRLPQSYEVLAFVPIMELTTYAGPPGSVTAFTGHGFAPGETIHAFLGEGSTRQEVATFQADSNGAFEKAGQFVIPLKGSGESLTVSLEGADSHLPVVQRFGVLALAPWAGLSAYSGHPGTQIEFHAKGFAVGETVDIILGKGEGAKQVVSGTTDSNGELTTSPYTIQNDSQGTLAFTFQGANSKGEATVDFTVVSTAQ